MRKVKAINFHYIRSNAPKRGTSGGDHLRGLAPGQRRNIAAVASRDGYGAGSVAEPKSGCIFWIRSRIRIWVFELKPDSDFSLNLKPKITFLHYAK